MRVKHILQNSWIRSTVDCDSMLSVKSISKSFQQNGVSLAALGSVSFDIRKGEFVVLVGPSGSGKTTLLKIIARLLEPSLGTIEHAKSNPRIGFVFQSPNLLSWRTVEENVRLPLEIKGKSRTVSKLLKLVGMNNFKDFLPDQLSGGMQQRAAIARALSFDPHILLMDEPFAALDDLARENLNLALTNIWKKTGKTIVFVTHNLEEAVFLADRIIVLSGSPARVKAVLPVMLDRPRQPKIKHSQEFQRHVKWLKLTLTD